MILLVIADDESLLAALPAERAAVLVACGDLPDELILKAAQRCRCTEIFAVKGNHDSSLDFTPPIRDVHLRVGTFGGVRFGGFAGAWKFKPKGNHLYEQTEAEAALARFPRVDIFVAHNSPRLVHDREDGVHTGFAAFTNYLSRARPRLFLHGHQHVNKETLVDGTRVVGTYGHRFLV